NRRRLRSAVWLLGHGTTRSWCCRSGIARPAARGPVTPSNDLSIVLATDGGPGLDDAVSGLRIACQGFQVELIVVVAGSPPAPAALHGGFEAVRVECHPAGTLTPILWGAGLRLARARHVAFTTDQVRVTPTWAQVLLGSLARGAVGVGGPIELSPDVDAT